MTQKVEKPAKAKKIQVFAGTELKAESNVHEDLIPTINELKAADIPEIKVVNHHYKVALLYSKGRYDKNYRVHEAEYVAPSKPTTEEAAAE